MIDRDTLEIHGTRARLCYELEVDGRLKAEFATKDGARAGAVELKKRFPMLQVRIYDALTKDREEILLPRV